MITSFCLAHFTEAGRVYATGLNDFGQLGVLENKGFSLVGYLETSLLSLSFCL